MKSYSHLYEQFISDENYYLAIYNATQNKGSKKSKRKKASYYRSHLEELKETLLNYAKNFVPDKHKPREIYDGIRRKKRIILVPSMREQVIHHMVVNILKPIIMRSMYRHAYGSLPGRGATKGKKKHSYGCKEAIEEYIHKHPENCSYCMKLDIQKFFDNISHDVLKQQFARIIKDKQFLEVIYKIIDSNNKDVGVPIGYYTSQWFANFYLIPLDHYIKEILHAKAYFRYMDDIVIFSSSKTELHRFHLLINNYLNSHLHLSLNSKWQIFDFHKRFLDFIGFRFYMNKTTLRRKLMLRMTHKARRIKKKAKTTLYDCRQMLSYKGWLSPTNTYAMYKNYIKPYISFNALSRRISWADKRRIQYVVS